MAGSGAHSKGLPRWANGEMQWSTWNSVAQRPFHTWTIWDLLPFSESLGNSTAKESLNKGEKPKFWVNGKDLFIVSVSKWEMKSWSKNHTSNAKVKTGQNRLRQRSPVTGSGGSMLDWRFGLSFLNSEHTHNQNLMIRSHIKANEVESVRELEWGCLLRADTRQTATLSFLIVPGWHWWWASRTGEGRAPSHISSDCSHFPFRVGGSYYF